MECQARPNLVLEALAYLGSRVNGGNRENLEKRFRSKGCRDVEALRQKFAPIQALQQLLDGRVDLPEALLKGLFTNLKGFFDNSSGAYSPAVLVFAPQASHWTGDLEGF